MMLQRTLDCGTQIWSPRRILSEDGKTVKLVSHETVMPIRIDTIKSETMYQMQYMSTTDMQSIKVSETNAPKDIITLVTGEMTGYFKDKKTGITTKIRFTWKEPKIIVVPVNTCDYGILAMKNPTGIIVKKNYKRMIISYSNLES